MSMKLVKVLKKDQKEATIGNVTVKITKGRTIVIKKDKEGKPLDTPVVKYREVESYYVDDEGQPHYELKNDRGTSYVKFDLVDVVTITTTAHDGTARSHTVALPVELATMDPVTIARIKAL